MGILQRTQEASVEALGSHHGENLVPLGHQAEQWLKQYGATGHSIVERLRLDAAGCDTTYYAWCIQAKREIEAWRLKAYVSAAPTPMSKRARPRANTEPEELMANAVKEALPAPEELSRAS